MAAQRFQHDELRAIGRDSKEAQLLCWPSH
jgi:hypothetical protein